MSPTTRTETHALVFGQEVSFGSIAGPFDSIDAYIDSAAFPKAVAEWRVYTVIAGQETLLASTKAGGREPTILTWNGPNGTYRPVQANGSTYELRAYWAEQGPAPTVKASIVGFDLFDTAGDSANAAAETLSPNFTEVSFGSLTGYAQFADVSVKQNFQAKIRFTLYALAGVLGVFAPVPGASIVLGQEDGTANIFSHLALPGASEYELRAFIEEGSEPVTVSAAFAVYSESTSAVFTAGGDLSGNAVSQTVIGWDGVPLDQTSMGSPSDAQIPIYDNAAGEWKARSITGDVQVLATGQTGVVGWAGVALNASMANPSIGDVPVFNGSTWVSTPETSFFTAAGDLSGSSSTQTVEKIHGATVPAGGSLTVGTVLRVTAASALGYGALDLANANAVTGLLPTANQVKQAMGGDVTGTTDAATVAKINGSSVPAGGGLTVGTVLRVTAASALAYGAVDLANAAAVTGLLPTANQVKQAMGGDVSGTTDAATVAKVNGATYPAGGSLTVGTVPRVTGSSAVQYGAVDLANAAAVTGLLPTANQASQAIAGDATGTTGALTVAKVNGTAIPASPAAGQLAVASSPTAASWASPDQSPLLFPFSVSPTHKYQIFFGISATNGTAAQSLGFASPTFNGTVASPNLSAASKLGCTKRVTYSQTAASARCGFFDGSYINAGVPQIGPWRGNSANRGGFLFRARFAISAIPVSAVLHSMIGLVGGSGGASSTNWVTDTTMPKIGMGFTCTTTAGGAFPVANWQILEGSASAVTAHDLGSGFALTVGDFIELIFYCTPNDTKISYTVNNLTTNQTASGVLNTTLPASTTPLMMMVSAFTDVTYASGTLTLDIAHAYSEWYDG